MILKSYDRRKFPVMQALLSLTFILALICLTFWVNSIDTKVRTIATLQASVLTSNIKFSEQCKGIKSELSRLNDQLNNIILLLIPHDRD